MSTSTTKTPSAAYSYFIEGKYPSWLDIEADGIDIGLLEKKHEAVVPILETLNCLIPLGIYCGRGTIRSIHVTDTQAQIRCIRLLRPDCDGRLRYPVLSLQPTGTGSSADIEVFLTADGEWLVYARVAFDDTYGILQYATTRELCAGLKLVEEADPSREYYRPNHTPVAVQVAQALDDLVDEQIGDREHTLRTLRSVREQMKEVDGRLYKP